MYNTQTHTLFHNTQYYCIFMSVKSNVCNNNNLIHQINHLTFSCLFAIIIFFRFSPSSRFVSSVGLFSNVNPEYVLCIVATHIIWHLLISFKKMFLFSPCHRSPRTIKYVLLTFFTV